MPTRPSRKLYNNILKQLPPSYRKLPVRSINDRKTFRQNGLTINIITNKILLTSIIDVQKFNNILRDIDFKISNMNMNMLALDIDNINSHNCCFSQNSSIDGTNVEFEVSVPVEHRKYLTQTKDIIKEAIKRCIY